MKKNIVAIISIILFVLLVSGCSSYEGQTVSKVEIDDTATEEVETIDGDCDSDGDGVIMEGDEIIETECFSDEDLEADYDQDTDMDLRIVDGIVYVYNEEEGWYEPLHDQEEEDDDYDEEEAAAAIRYARDEKRVSELPKEKADIIESVTTTSYALPEHFIGETDWLRCDYGLYDLTVNSVELVNSYKGKSPENDFFVIVDMTVLNIDDETIKINEIPSNEFAILITKEGKFFRNLVGNVYGVPVPNPISVGESHDGKLVFDIKKSDYYYLSFGYKQSGTSSVRNWYFTRKEISSIF